MGKFTEWLNEKSLRNQMIILSGGSNSTCLLVMLIICISLLAGTNNTIKNDSEKALFSQIERNVKKISDGSTKWFSTKQTIGSQGFVNPYAEATEDTYRPDYSMGFKDSYLEYGNTYLSQFLNLTQDSRQTKPASFEHSAYYVPNAAPADIPTFSQVLNDTRDQTAHLDPFFRPLYKQNVDFVAAYTGFENTGMFRHYPGIGTLDTDPNRNYDPRVRGWYTTAKANPHTTIYTSPYRDFNGKGWMITIARSIHNTNTGQFVGVAGADMLISSIRDTIGSIKFLETGKITLFEEGGVVVVDKEWAADPNDNRGMKVEDLDSPKVSSELFEKITSVSAGDTESFSEEIDGDKYLITSTKLAGFGNKYFFVVFIPEKEITAPMDSIIDEMVSVNLGISLGFSFSSLVFGILVILLIMYIANRITKPITRIGKNIDMMVANIGEDDPMRGVKRVDTGDAYSDEVTQFGRHFNDMVGVVQEWRDDAMNTSIQNDFYGGQHEWIAPPAYTEQAHASATAAPGIFPMGAPPPYDQAMAEKQAEASAPAVSDSDTTTTTTTSGSSDSSSG